MRLGTAWPSGARAPRDLVWRLLRHTIGGGDEACLRKLLPQRAVAGREEIDRLMDELRDSDELADAVDSAQARAQSPLRPELTGRNRLLAQMNLQGTGYGRALLLYAAARLARPAVVVETGCFTGWDSAMLLQALDRNGLGQLYSIDLPAEEGRFSQAGPGSALRPGLPIGLLVPPAFKARWTLIVGDIRDELGPLLDRIGQVDLFYHDSDHSYPHMTWELNTVWPHLAQGALVVADDIAWSTAFWDFARKMGRHPVIHRHAPNVGALSK